MDKNTSFWDSKLTVNKFVMFAKLTFEVNVVLIRMPLVCLWELGKIIPKFIGSNMI